MVENGCSVKCPWCQEIHEIVLNQLMHKIGDTFYLPDDPDEIGICTVKNAIVLIRNGIIEKG